MIMSGSRWGRTQTEKDLAGVRGAFGVSRDLGEAAAQGDLAGSERTSAYLTHPVFNTHHSETAMLRYLRALSDRDFALDRGMIPLGSCTMKLNATTEMEPISYPGLRPRAAPVRAGRGREEGYATLIAELEALAGRGDRVRRRSRSGRAPTASQGELRRLLAIRAYHDAPRMIMDRAVCLIPSSAHGTNAASAVMAGDEGRGGQGRRGRLGRPGRPARPRSRRTATRWPTIMVTYPSTHGVFEETIVDLCALVHDAGGQVYVDGANLNALLGLAKPGRFGADVSHLNLHKTFCIPHGGGGPGDRTGRRRGSPGAAPAESSAAGGEARPDSGIGPISAAPYGSAGILPISYAYIAMMGADGLTLGDSACVAGRQLRRRPARRALPRALLRPPRPGRPRVHPRSAADHQGQRDQRR